MRVDPFPSPPPSLLQYESVQVALSTRARLHGTKWPSTNPKLLAVDFLSAEEALRLSDGELQLEEERVWPKEKPEVGVVSGEGKEEGKEEEAGKAEGESEAVQSQGTTCTSDHHCTGS